MRGLTLVLVVTSLTCPLAQAQTVPSSGRRVVQETWTFQQGAPEYIQAIAQTTDGFLWLGGPNGLVRFDGMRFEPFHAVAGDQLLSTNVYSLYAPSSGGLWIGYTFGGFSFVNNGKVKNYGDKPAIAAGTVSDFAQGPDGTMWAGTGNGVWRLEGSTWRHLGSDWSAPAVFLELLAFDRAGTLWLVGGNNLFYLLPGSRQFRVASKGNVQFSGFTKDPEGFVLTRPITQQLTAPIGQSDKQLHDYPIFRNDFIAVVDRNQGVWLNRFNVRPAINAHSSHRNAAG